ncbi:MAG: hypothetical protein L0229_29915 [Blastocatellia bacterium]|nr:hypothetical protein [Blastocatellia bacterium]
MATFSFFKPLLQGPLTVILFAILLLEVAGPLTQTAQGSVQSRRRSSFFNKKMTERQKQILSPSAEDMNEFAHFLRQSDTGLFRLLPKGKYEFTNTVSADRDPDTILPIRGGGAFYSFTEKTHRYGPWSEIVLLDGHIRVGFTRESLGLLAALGDAPLESLTLQSPRVRFLAEYKPPDNYGDALVQRKQLLQGMKGKDFTYYSAYPAIPNSTYIVRSVSYKKEGRIELGRLGQSIYRSHPAEYRGADVIVAFRIVRRDADDSLIILWKKLRKFRSQKLKGELRNPSLEEIKETIESEAPIGSTVSQVTAFLTFRGISHSHFTEKQESVDEDSASISKRIINASISRVRGKRGARYNLHIRFLFDEDRKLVDCEIEAIAR